MILALTLNWKSFRRTSLTRFFTFDSELSKKIIFIFETPRAKEGQARSATLTRLSGSDSNIKDENFQKCQLKMNPSFFLLLLLIGFTGAYYPGYQVFYQQDPRLYYGYGQQGIPAAYMAAQQAQQQQLLAQRGYGGFAADPGYVLSTSVLDFIQ